MFHASTSAQLGSSFNQLRMLKIWHEKSDKYNTWTTAHAILSQEHSFCTIFLYSTRSSALTKTYMSMCFSMSVQGT